MAGVYYIALLAAFAGTALVLGFRYRRFAFVAYGIVYGYIGISFKVFSSIRGDTAALTYIVVTGTIVIVVIAILARRFGGEE